MLTPDTELRQPTAGADPWRARWARSDLRHYLAAGAIATAVAIVYLRLWEARWSVPFYYSGDAVASLAHVKTTLQTGWYEYQPDLGAPYGQHYSDYPLSDDLHPALFKVFGLFTGNAPVVFNLYYVIGFPLAALTALWFLRRCGLRGFTAVALATLFAVAPYHFVRNENHLYLASYWAVPLGLGVVLDALRGRPLWGRRAGAPRVLDVLTGRGAGTVLMLVLVTLSSAYYGLFTVVLLIPAVIAGAIRTRDLRRTLGGVAAVVLIGVVEFLAMLPDRIYAAANGADTGALTRQPSEAMTLAFKIIALVLPAPGHPVDSLAALREKYITNFPYSSELPALGTIASVGFVALLLLPLVRAAGPRPAGERRTSPRRRTLTDLALLTWVGVLAGTFGGLGTLIAVFVTDNIRGWNRLSIFLMLLGLAAAGLASDAVADRWARRVRADDPGPGRQATRRITAAGLAAALLIVGVGDQDLTITVPPYAQAQTAWDNDAQFVAALEQRLPEGAMIFQLPYRAFPESEPLNGIPEADQLRLWLHSDTLRWSAGGIKGRPQTDWPSMVVSEGTSTMTTDLVSLGFAGIVVDRFSYQDGAAALERGLQQVLGDPVLNSPDNRYAFYDLAPVAGPGGPAGDAAQRAARAAEILGSGR
ncbi:hypothetical protein GIS00_09135 [Nakamurella sp. YIM 132087]|uniref:DUF6311 domain-containing protein n=1 Tax=Nakamurella alba TaxID=2665158 RepID=A0A7K1FJ06_9ACTN|nr:hypothetical protein [Nakamurella alba]MTD14107.1 hypothetical protein [Nakamurella alba]